MSLLLSEPELGGIEETAYRLLAEVGVAMQHPRAVEMLHARGCRVEKGRVFMPRPAVEWACAHVAGHDEHYRRDGSLAFRLGDGARHYHNAGGRPFIIAGIPARRRPPALRDVIDCVRLLDALPGIDMISPPFYPADVPAPVAWLHAFAALLRNTSKPVGHGGVNDPAEVPYALEMAAACCGGDEALRSRPFMTTGFSPVSPLTLPDKIVEAIMALAAAGVPLHVTPAPTLGATGPITLAGSVALQHAEFLASTVLIAATSPGAPVVYNNRIAPVDLRSGASGWGGPESGMAGVVSTQLAHRLGLPCDTYGFCTSSAKVDAQLGYEHLMSAVLPAQANADFLSGVGDIDTGLSFSPEAAVVDDELIGLLKYALRPMEVSDETLAFDLIRDVVEGDSVFLGQPHTVQHMRRGALWMPGVTERAVGSTEDERAGVLARAHQRAKELIARHEPAPLPEDVSRRLDEILERAGRELGKK